MRNMKVKPTFVDGKSDPNFHWVRPVDASLIRLVQEEEGKKEPEEDPEAWKKMLPDQSQDIRSDELKKKKYYEEKKIVNFWKDVFKTNGDQTNLSEFSLNLTLPLLPVS